MEYRLTLKILNPPTSHGDYNKKWASIRESVRHMDMSSIGEGLDLELEKCRHPAYHQQLPPGKVTGV